VSTHTSLRHGAAKGARSMASDDGFYIQLPSNASPDLFPDNTTASYKTALARRVTLPGEGWTVALIELTYPQTLQNIYPGNNDITFHFPGPQKRMKYEVRVPPDRYRSVFSLVKVVNKVIRDALSVQPELLALWKVENSGEYTGDFFHVQSDGKIVTTPIPIDSMEAYKEEGKLGMRKMQMTLNETLAGVLGFKNPHFLLNRSEVRQGDMEAAVTLGVPQLCFVYCDAVEPVLVGHSEVPLLRCLRVWDQDTSLSSPPVMTPIYQPVATRDFSSLEIDLKDHTGHPMPFQCGHSSVLLHFKRRSSA